MEVFQKIIIKNKNHEKVIFYIAPRKKYAMRIRSNCNVLEDVYDIVIILHQSF